MSGPVSVPTDPATVPPAVRNALSTTR